VPQQVSCQENRLDALLTGGRQQPFIHRLPAMHVRRRASTFIVEPRRD
jgi:hypothetical protein